jgi:hypothetical protein
MGDAQPLLVEMSRKRKAFLQHRKKSYVLYTL